MPKDFSTGQEPKNFGRHFIVGLNGPSLNDDDKRLLATLQPVGVLLLKHNFKQTVPYAEWLGTWSKLKRDICEYSETENPILSIDHEGGRVHRLPTPITQFPYARAYKDCPREVAKVMATELKSLGLNVSWSPLADINWNEGNPVIGERSFGSEARDVIQPCLEFLKGLHELGVLGCAKHFPGHGGSSLDSHFALPQIPSNLIDLKHKDLLPFVELIKANVPLIMTAHILFPNIDPNNIATLSSIIMKDLLRKELDFRGVLVTDDIDMQAITKDFGVDSALAKTISASCDMMIVSKDTQRAVELALKFPVLLKDRKISEQELFDSSTRIEDLLNSRLKQFDVKILPEETFAKHEQFCREIC